MIGHKLKYVLLPKMREDRGQELKDCIIIFIFYYNKIIKKRGFMGSFIIMSNPCNVILLINRIFLLLKRTLSLASTE